MTFEVEHQSPNNYACQKPDKLCSLLRNEMKLEIFGCGHLSVESAAARFMWTLIIQIQIKTIFLLFDVLTRLSQ